MIQCAYKPHIQPTKKEKVVKHLRSSIASFPSAFRRYAYDWFCMPQRPVARLAWINGIRTTRRRTYRIIAERFGMPTMALLPYTKVTETVPEVQELKYADLHSYTQRLV